MWEFIGYCIVASGFIFTGLAILSFIVGSIISITRKIKSLRKS